MCAQSDSHRLALSPKSCITDLSRSSVHISFQSHTDCAHQAHKTTAPPLKSSRNHNCPCPIIATPSSLFQEPTLALKPLHSYEHQVHLSQNPPRTPPSSQAHRVRTLTGKEIELDIEPEYKVHSNLPLPPSQNSKIASETKPCDAASKRKFLDDIRLIWGSGVPHKGARGGERGYTACAATVDFWGKADVSLDASPSDEASPQIVFVRGESRWGCLGVCWGL